MQNFLCQLSDWQTDKIIKDKNGKDNNYTVLTFSPFYETDKGIKVSTGEKSKDKWILLNSALAIKLAKMTIDVGLFYDVEVSWEGKIIDIHNLKTK
ncbi:hypothetical protein [Spiroplasma endosymbiont of Nebria brevicollis]|uniref:hypothetical protein n=1 Tax=Spiroplasma endosymbiont of Nebria brevicollis TaxID=3066284 RepID=UPI00313D6B5B